MSECNPIEETYYQRNRNAILNSVKDYYENDKKRLRYQARGKYRTYLKQEEIKRENMEERDTAICLKKRNKN